MLGPILRVMPRRRLRRSYLAQLLGIHPLARDRDAQSEALGVNDLAVVVGRSFGGGDHPVRWINGVPTPLPADGIVAGLATGINNAGDVVGTVVIATEAALRRMGSHT